MITSQNGWPASTVSSEIQIKSFVVGGVKLRCAEAALPLLKAFTEQYHEHIDPLIPGQCWGYAYRNIRGSKELSNHASGTAIDLNSLKNPLGAIGTYTVIQIVLLDALIKKYGLRAGYNYHGRKDPMHFEISLNEAKTAALIEKLGLSNKKEETNEKVT